MELGVHRRVFGAPKCNLTCKTAAYAQVCDFPATTAIERFFRAGPGGTSDDRMRPA